MGIANNHQTPNSQGSTHQSSPTIEAGIQVIRRRISRLALNHLKRNGNEMLVLRIVQDGEKRKEYAESILAKIDLEDIPTRIEVKEQIRKNEGSHIDEVPERKVREQRYGALVEQVDEELLVQMAEDVL